MPVRPLLLALALLALALPAMAQAPGGARGQPPAAASGNANRIVAVVNGDAVTQAEVASRTRLFALNAGVQLTPEALQRLEPQVLRLLVDERLRMQEVQRRRVPVSDTDVAESVAEIERRNNMSAGGLRAQLRQANVQQRSLFDQLRTQIGWGRLMRALLGAQAEVSEAEANDAVNAYRARQGQTEYLVGEIFLPVDEPANEAQVRAFADEVIAQLRRGTPFPVVATQFSQSQTAVQGGDLGWVGTERLDPEVAIIVERMPQGAVSNPIRVAGGFQVITLRAKRQVGQEQNVTVLSVRQLFLPFAETLDPQRPTDQQRQTLEQAQRLAETLRSCEQMAAQPRSSDPGPVQLEALNPPPLRALLGSQPLNRPTEPIISPDGIMLIMVCSRERRNMAEFTPEIARSQILRDRVETLSRQLQRELRRRAVIEIRAQQ
jgi:peptidyl-prolyl cis-trans isomerase SurA